VSDEDADFRKQVGERVRAARYKAGLTQQDLAAHLGITHQQINKVERGNANPVFRRIVQIAQATGHDVSFFVPAGYDPGPTVPDVSFHEFQLVKRLARLPKPQYRNIAKLVRSLLGESANAADGDPAFQEES